MSWSLFWVGFCGLMLHTSLNMTSVDWIFLRCFAVRGGAVGAAALILFFLLAGSAVGQPSVDAPVDLSGFAKDGRVVVTRERGRLQV